MSTPEPPHGRDLLALEARARRQGSGLSADDLLGAWWLDQLWDRQGQAQTTAAVLLRSLGARLAITAAPTAEASAQPGDAMAALRLHNSIQLGALTLQFSGPGWLVGQRPLLRFQFERMALLWGARELWHAALPPQPSQRLPFFALIAANRAGDGGWLAARGRGGGLAAWRLRPSADRG